MKPAVESTRRSFEGALRPDLIAIFAYASPCGRTSKSVDGTTGPEVHLSRLAAAARMQ